MDDATAARLCGTWYELCLFLDGSPSSFIGMLLTLIEKADPGNRHQLRQEFPRQVAAWEAWREIAPCTWGELEAAIRAGASARTVTYNLSDPDVAHVLDAALKDYANQAEENARRGDGEVFTRWAAVADLMRAQAEAAGS